MDVALGFNWRPGPPKGAQREGLQTAIHVHYLRLWGETWERIADRYQKDVRTLQRIYETHSDGIVEHLSGDLFVPLGYDVEDGKLIVNEGEAATVRMIFERFARSGPAQLLRALEAQGITGKRGKPIDEGYLYRLLKNPIYVGEAVRKGMYPGKHKAIVGRAPEQSSQDFVGCYAKTGVKNA